jgi:hypothetical protein
MSRIHYVPLPDSDTEIVEEVTYRQRTSRGMKIKQERAPMEQPLRETTGKTSHSRSKNKSQAQLRHIEEPLPDNTGEGSRSRSKNQRSTNLRHVEEPLLELDGTGYLDTHDIIEEENDIPEPGPRPQAVV